MFRNYIFILSFLFCFNTVSQNIESIQVDDDQKISDFLINYDISPNDFFILNPAFTSSRFNYSKLDLEKKLKAGDFIRIFELVENNKSEQISFIIHKIKRKQTLSEISSIYGVSENLILKYNIEIEIKRNNILKIPIDKVRINKSNVVDKLKAYTVKPKEGKWRIAYKYGISINTLENINPEIGSILKLGQKIAVPNKDEIKLNSIEENNDYFEIQKNIQISVLEQKLGLKNNSIIKLNPGILDSVEKGIIIKVPISTKTNEDVINLSKKSLQDNIIDFDKKKFAIILPFRLDNFDYDSIQKSTPILKNDKLLNSGLIQDALKWGEPDNIYWFENPVWKATRRIFAGQNKWWTNPKDYFTMVGYEPPCKIKWGSHHKSHMAAGYYTSPFKECATLVIDAIGEFTTTSIGIYETDGSGKISGKKLYARRYPQSLGLFYSAITDRVKLKANEGL